MKKREIYRLQLDGNAVIVFRTDPNRGRQGVVFGDGTARSEYNQSTIPKYIRDEAKQLMVDKNQ